MDDFLYSPIVSKLINVMNFFLCIKVLDADEIDYPLYDEIVYEDTDTVVITDNILDNTNIIPRILPQEGLNDCISMDDELSYNKQEIDDNNKINIINNFI